MYSVKSLFSSFEQPINAFRVLHRRLLFGTVRRSPFSISLEKIHFTSMRNQNVFSPRSIIETPFKDSVSALQKRHLRFTRRISGNDQKKTKV